MLEEIEFGANKILAIAALTPGMRKPAEEVDISHRHRSLAHYHASLLRGAAEQHGIRLTGEGSDLA